MDNVKDMIGSVFLTEMSAQSYCQYVRSAKKALRQEGVLFLVEILNGDDAGLKCLGILLYMTSGFYNSSTEDQPALGKAASSSFENPNKPGSFPAHIFYTIAKIFQWELRAVFLITVQTLLRNDLST